MSEATYRFGTVAVQREARQVLVTGDVAKLSARAFDLLVALIDRRDRMVTKSELLDVVWPGLVVEENNLQVHIWALRKLLGPLAISTIPGRGYRFTAALDVDAEAGRGVAVAALPQTSVSEPTEAAALFGRENDLVNVPQWLVTNRLVTLIGAGGIGKTTLAKALVANLKTTFDDGTWLVDFAALNEGEQLVPAIARTLNVTLGAGTPATALAQSLSNRSALIVLDNCEHLLLPVAALAAELLNAASRLHVLATSQEPLKLPGERLYRLLPLALPDQVTVEKARDAGAVRLFVERVRQADQRFALTDENVAVVVDICAQLDGIALAIELAAARVALLGVNGVRDRLGQRLSLLSSSRVTPGLTARHQTLRAALQWSHGLLSTEQQTVFQRLGVMSGRFSLEAAQQVASDAAIDEWAVLDHLGALVEKSLVVAELNAQGAQGAQGEMTYRLLETMRDFALEQIGQSGEEAATRERHLAFCLDLAERAYVPLRGPKQALWLALLDRDHDNLLAAHAWCDHALNGTERGLRMVALLIRFWPNRGMVTQGLQACLAAIARPHVEHYPRLLGDALATAGYLCACRGLDVEASEHFQKSLAIARVGEYGDLVTKVLAQLGTVYMNLGERAHARRCLEEALAVARGLDDVSDSVEFATHALADLEQLEGNIDAARVLFEACLRGRRARGDRVNTMVGLTCLATIAVMQSEPQRAQSMLLESLMIANEIEAKRWRLVAMEICAGLAATLKQWPLVARFDAAADIHTTQMGRRRDAQDVAFLTPLVVQAKSALVPEICAAAVAAGRALSYEEAVEEVTAWLRSLKLTTLP